jgi:lipid-binding SYLF domain-containing protein
MMKNSLRFITLAFGLSAIASAPLTAEKQSYIQKLNDRIERAEWVLETIMVDASSTIPRNLLRQAKGIIILNQYRAGFIFGGQGGNGVLIVRNPQTGKWGVPGFLTAGQASFGLQAGYTEINNIFLLMTDEAVRKSYSGRFNIGVDAKAVAGPVGRTAEKFDLFKAEVLAYTGSSGLFAGATVKSGWVKVDDKGNRAFYNTTYSSPEVLLSTWFKLPPAAQALLSRLHNYEGQ